MSSAKTEASSLHGTLAHGTQGLFARRGARGGSAVRHRFLRGKLTPAPAVALLISLAAGCGDSYERGKSIEGVFRPSGCVQIEGRRDGWLSFPTTTPTICQPIRVSELGVMTYGWEVAQPGFRAEVGRLEFSDAAVYIVTERLRQYGQFEYSEREPTLKDSINHHPILVTMMILFFLVVAIGFSIAAVGKRNEFVRLREEVARSRSAVISALQRRIDLVNRMLELALHYEAYERDIIEMVTRSASQRNASVGAVITNLSTAYPNLRASEGYQELMRQMASQEQDTRQALDAHNAAAATHNTTANQFPWNMFWSSGSVAYLDMSMEETLLPARWDAKQLRFTPRDVSSRKVEGGRGVGS